MENKISVVVPIYNVEKYLHRCIDTIVNQTYPNLEIILVDDGSPDNCGTIAEDYAKTDWRITVVHKKNGGLSDARNDGMQYVTGDFTLFVDSDDWLEKNMIEEMVHMSLRFKADVVQSAFYYAFEDHLLFDNRYYQKEDPPIVLDNKALMTELIINERVKNFAWGKLFKTEIIKDIPFKEGVLFEDVFWAHKVMHRINTYVILHQPLCYYFQRSDSIVSAYSLGNLDIIEGLKNRQKFIEENYKELALDSFCVLLKTILIHYNLLFINRKKDKGSLFRKELKMFVDLNYVKCKKAAENDPDTKTQLMLFMVSPYLNIFYLFIRKIYRKIRGKSQNNGFERILISEI